MPRASIDMHACAAALPAPASNSTETRADTVLRGLSMFLAQTRQPCAAPDRDAALALDALDMSELVALTEAMTDVPAILVQDDDTAREMGQLDADPAHGVGALLIFDDFSALYTDMTGHLSPMPLHSDRDPRIFPDLFHADGPLARCVHVRATSPAFARLYGTAETWRARLPRAGVPFPDDPLLDFTGQILEDLDPPVDAVDLSDHANWTAQDQRDIEDALTCAWIATGAVLGVVIEIHAATDTDTAQVDVSFHPPCTGPSPSDLPLPDEDVSALRRDVVELVHSLICVTDYTGWHWEYNDGASDRLSGYARLPQIVVGLDIDPAHAAVSAHQRLEARPRTLDRLVARGQTRAEATALLDRIASRAGPG